MVTKIRHIGFRTMMNAFIIVCPLSSAAHAVPMAYDFSEIAIPGQQFGPRVVGINNSHQVTGFASYDQNTGYQAFVDTLTAANQFDPTTFKLLTPPGGHFFPGEITGINDLGQVVGQYDNFSAGNATAFVATPNVSGSYDFSEIAIPGQQYGPSIAGINNSHQVTGFAYYDPDAGYQAFVDTLTATNQFDPNTLKYLTPPGGLFYPGEITGINDLGQVVGVYDSFSRDGGSVGFVATPNQTTGVREPSTLALLGTAILALLLLRKRKVCTK